MTKVHIKIQIAWKIKGNTNIRSPLEVGGKPRTA